MKRSLILVATLFLLTPNISKASISKALIDIKALVKESTPGKNFAALLVDAGFNKKIANRLLSDHIIPPKIHINPHEKYLVVRDEKTNRTEARFYMEYSDEALVFWHDAERSGVEKRPIHFEITKKHYSGKVRGSLIESIKRLVSDEWAAFRFSDAFSWDINLNKQLVQNDTFKFTIEEKYDEGKFVKFGEITEAELGTHGTLLKRILWQNDLAKVFVDPSTHFDDRLFYAPIDYVHISSLFAKRRLHPVRHNYQPHLGVDFALNEGAPVYAACDGIVFEAAHHHANGNYIMIRHAGDFITTYNHLDHFAPNITPGSKVSVGDIIGYVGCTGYCTSPHLDFRIRHGDYLYDPLYLTKPYPFKERHYWESNKFKQLLGTLTTANSTQVQEISPVLKN